MPNLSEEEKRKRKRDLDRVNKSRAKGEKPVGKQNEKRFIDSIGRKIRGGPDVIKRRKKNDKQGKGNKRESVAERERRLLGLSFVSK